MTPTRRGVLVALGVGAFFAVFALLLLGSVSLPAVPWTLPVALGALAGGMLVAAFSFRRRLRGEPGAKPYDPLHAARMVVLAKACAHAGAVLVGGYAAVAVALVVQFDSPARRLDALVCALSALAALAVLAVGLLLERFCRVPPPEDPGDPDGRGGGQGQDAPTRGS